eukprot:scaffold291_cov123-Isochrysis_galbana.AAC.2
MARCSYAMVNGAVLLPPQKTPITDTAPLAGADEVALSNTPKPAQDPPPPPLKGKLSLARAPRTLP